MAQGCRLVRCSKSAAIWGTPAILSTVVTAARGPLRSIPGSAEARRSLPTRGSKPSRPTGSPIAWVTFRLWRLGREQSRNLIAELGRLWFPYFLVALPEKERDPARAIDVVDRAPLGLGLFLCRSLGREFLLHRVDGCEHGALGRAVALHGKRQLVAHHRLDGRKAHDLVTLPRTVTSRRPPPAPTPARGGRSGRATRRADCRTGPSGTAYATEACGVRQRRGSVRLHPGLLCDGRSLLRLLEASSREGDRRRKKTRRRSALAGTAEGLQLRHFSYPATKTRPVKERLTGRKRTGSER